MFFLKLAQIYAIELRSSNHTLLFKNYFSAQKYHYQHNKLDIGKIFFTAQIGCVVAQPSLYR